jgi:hypothetical protein
MLNNLYGLIAYLILQVIPMFPKVAARPVEEVIGLIGRAVRVSTALTLVTAIAVTILGPVVLIGRRRFSLTDLNNSQINFCFSEL